MTTEGIDVIRQKLEPHFRDAFCLYRKLPRGYKVAKRPYSPDGRAAKPNDPATFGTLDACLKRLDRCPGQYDGLCARLPDGVVLIDLDHHRDADTGDLDEFASGIMARFKGCSYAEVSPSGTGVHILLRADKLSYDKGIYFSRRDDIGLEVYVGGYTSRIATLTGSEISDGSPEHDATAELQQLLDDFMRKSERDALPVEMSAEGQSDEFDDLDDEILLSRMLSSSDGEKISALWAGQWGDMYESQSSADLALLNYLAFWTKRNPLAMDRMFRKSALYREKWERDDYRRTSIDQAIRGCTSVYDPDYSRNHVLSSVETETVGRCLAFLRERDAVNSYDMHDTSAGQMLADYLKPIARPLTGTTKGWRVYNGRCWEDDPDGNTAGLAAAAMGRAILKYAADLTNESTSAAWAGFGRRWLTFAYQRNVVQCARKHYPVSRGEFDADPMLLNVRNGTLDLRDFSFREHSPEDLLSQMCNADYDPDARSELWENTIAAILPDVQTREFLQRWCGYCLTGSTREECMTIWLGRSSRNGKSTVAETVMSTVGSYGLAVAPETFNARRDLDGSRPSEDVARMAGRRFIVASEPSQTLTLDAARLKNLTGGDTVVCRRLNEGSFEFRMCGKISINTNHRPVATDMTLFWSDRIHVIPFNRHFTDEERDRYLKEKLSTEEVRSAVLNWCLAGLKDYQLFGGLVPSPEMKEALREYAEYSDKVSRFMGAMLPKHDDPKWRVRLSDVYSEYCSWCASEGMQSTSLQRFKEDLIDRGVTIVKNRPSDGGSVTACVVGRKFIRFMAYELSLTTGEGSASA